MVFDDFVLDLVVLVLGFALFLWSIPVWFIGCFDRGFEDRLISGRLENISVSS